jgi:hypothetical protein
MESVRMKAEHRKVLETNVLADRLGKMVSTVKQGPQRGTAMYVVLGILVAALVFFSVRWYRVTKNENAEAWVFFEQTEPGYNHKPYLDNYGHTTPGKIVQLALARRLVWDEGIKKLGVDTKGALQNLEAAAFLYEKLLADLKDDPFLEPEILYGLAQITETQAIQDRDKLDVALEKYQELARNHRDTAYGQLAEKRAEVLGNEKGKADVARVYQELQTSLRLFDRK